MSNGSSSSCRIRIFFLILLFIFRLAEDLLEVIRNGMDRDREVYRHRQEQPQQQSSTSIADELMKLANLKERGIISEEEFQQMKQDLIKKKT